MKREIATDVLGRLSRDVFGSGAEPSHDGGDDRSGRYWKVTDPKIALAVKIALITGRPLLLEGPSGTGKSSLARAVAETLGWTYYEAIVSSQTQVEALVGTVDHVGRLYAAELASRAPQPTGAGDSASATAAANFDPDPARFLVPGVLWWAFDPASATTAGQAPQGSRVDPGKPARIRSALDGAVVLIDEIDKADPDLPNNLLVPFGAQQLDVDARTEPVFSCRDVLLVVTSNQERDLPPAFLRRCVTLHLDYSPPDELVMIAKQHVRGADALAETVRAKFLSDGKQLSTAEFVDAVRAAVGLGLDVHGTDPIWEQVGDILQSAHFRRRA
jgi:MoxR-like ATPase